MARRNQLARITTVVLAAALQRPATNRLATIRRRVTMDALALGAERFPNGCGFYIGPAIEVTYYDGLPWVSYVAVATVHEWQTLAQRRRKAVV